MLAAEIERANPRTQMTLSLLIGVEDKEWLDGSYPINALRNLALSAVTTPLVPSSFPPPFSHPQLDSLLQHFCFAFADLVSFLRCSLSMLTSFLQLLSIQQLPTTVLLFVHLLHLLTLVLLLCQRLSWLKAKDWQSHLTRLPSLIA